MPFQFGHSLIRPLFAATNGILSPAEDEAVAVPSPSENTLRFGGIYLINTTPPGVGDRTLVVNPVLVTEEFGELVFPPQSGLPLSVGGAFALPVLINKPEKILLRVHPSTGAAWTSAQFRTTLLDCPATPEDSLIVRLTTAFQEVVPPTAVGQRLADVFSGFGSGLALNTGSNNATVSGFLEQADGSQLLIQDLVVTPGNFSFFTSFQGVLQPGERAMMKVDPAATGPVYTLFDWLDVPAARR